MKKVSVTSFLKALARASARAIGSALFSTIPVVLSITMGICVLLILGAEDLALKIVPAIPASVVNAPIYFIIKQTFEAEPKILIEEGKGIKNESELTG